MAVLLTVLSVIGRILLILLLVLLVLILLILLVPFRYSAAADGDSGGSLAADGSVTWLFRAVRLSFFFRKEEDGNSTGAKLWIFGVSPAELLEKLRRKKREKRKKEKKKRLEKIRKRDPGRYEQLRREALERKKERRDAAEARKAEDVKEDMPEPKPGNRVARKQRRRQRRISLAARALLRIRRLMNRAGAAVFNAAFRIAGAPAKAAGKLKEKLAAAAALCRRISKWTDFLTDSRTGLAVLRLKRTAFTLLGHVRPRRVSGRAEFGFDDPALTGEAAGIAWALRPSYGDSLVLTPVFTEQRFAGRLQATGRVILMRVLIALVPVVLDRNVRYCYHFIKNRDKEVSE